MHINFVKEEQETTTLKTPLNQSRTYSPRSIKKQRRILKTCYQEDVQIHQVIRSYKLTSIGCTMEILVTHKIAKLYLTLIRGLEVLKLSLIQFILYLNNQNQKTEYWTESFSNRIVNEIHQTKTEKCFQTTGYMWYRLNKSCKVKQFRKGDI